MNTTAADEVRRIYQMRPDSPGLRSGAILMPQAQYDFAVARMRAAEASSNGIAGLHLVTEYESQWEAIRVTSTCTMYRYRFGILPYTGRRYVPNAPIDEPKDAFDLMWNDHVALVSGFEEKLTDAVNGSLLVEGDEDEDFTYGAFCEALTNLGLHEAQWVLAREFGNYYSARHIDILLNS